MSAVKNIFLASKPYVIGMIHVNALPGTPHSSHSVKALIDQAWKEAEIYKSNNLDAVLIENMHDLPYIQPNIMGPEVTATMTRICSEIRRILPLNMACGVQILAGANKEALAVAHASNLQFIRTEGYVYSHIADEGIMNSCAGELLRYRKNIGATNVLVFTDIKKKHCSHSITNDIDIIEMAKAAAFFLSDGIILTGKSTGEPTDTTELETVKSNCNLPILVGSGVTSENVENYLEADAIIVGSYFKKDGNWRNEVDNKRVQSFMEALEGKRESQKAS